MIVTVTLNGAIDKIYMLNSVNKTSVNRARVLSSGPGGKGVNVSRALLALGENKTLVTGLFGGHSGRLALEGLKAEGIPQDVVVHDRESRFCLTLLEGEERKYWGEINEVGEGVDIKNLKKIKDKVEKLSKHAGFIVFSGSIPDQWPEETYFDLIKIASDRGCKTVLDANGKVLECGIQASPWLVKINNSELLGLIEERKRRQMGSSIDSAKQMLQMSCFSQVPNLIITLGSKGCVARLGKEMYSGATARKVKAVCSVGSGDSFLAGYLFGSIRGWSRERRLKLALACGAANALNIQAGAINPAIIETMLKYSLVSRIDS